MCLRNQFSIQRVKITAHIWLVAKTLQWRHNECYGVSNHQPHDCLLNHLFRHRSKKTPKHRVTGLCEGNSPVTGEFPAQMASNGGNISIRWRHHELFRISTCQLLPTCWDYLLSKEIKRLYWHITIVREDFMSKSVLLHVHHCYCRKAYKQRCAIFCKMAAEVAMLRTFCMNR